jgi:hypothetical protein
MNASTNIDIDDEDTLETGPGPRPATRLDELFASRRFCYFIPDDGFVKGRGYRVSVVFENEPGHYPTGDWPFEAGLGQKAPWFWGRDLAEARSIAVAENARIGVSEELAVKIVGSSIGAQLRARNATK